jgi:hypothetical protein
MRLQKSIAVEPLAALAGAAPAAEPGWQSWRPAPGAAIEIRWQGSAHAGYAVRVYALAAPPTPPLRPCPRRLAHLQRRESPTPPAEVAFLLATARLPLGKPAALPFSARFAGSTGPLLRGTVAVEPLPEGGSRLVVRGLVHAGGEVPFAVLAAAEPIPASDSTGSTDQTGPAGPTDPTEPTEPGSSAASGDPHA